MWSSLAAALSPGVTPFLQGKPFDPEMIAAMSRTLEKVCGELGLTLQDPAAEVIASNIIELAQRGVKASPALYLATMAGFKLDGQKLS